MYFCTRPPPYMSKNRVFNNDSFWHYRDNPKDWEVDENATNKPNKLDKQKAKKPTSENKKNDKLN